MWSLLRNLAGGLWGLFRKEQVEREMDEELRGYLEAAMSEFRIMARAFRTLRVSVAYAAAPGQHERELTVWIGQPTFHGQSR